MQARAGGRAARAGPPGGPPRPRHRARAPAPGRAGLAPRSAAPRVPRRGAGACETPQTFRLGRNGLDVCLHDHLRRGRGPPHRAEPAEGGGPPVGSPRSAALGPQHERVQPPLGGLHSSAGLFARPTPGAARGLRDGRARDGRAVAGAHAPGPVPGVTTVGVAAVARLWGQAGAPTPQRGPWAGRARASQEPQGPAA
jgi:hypothetical protein